MNFENSSPPSGQSDGATHELQQPDKSRSYVDLGALKHSQTAILSEFYTMLTIVWLYMLLNSSRSVKLNDSWADILLLLCMVGMTFYCAYRSYLIRKCTSKLRKT